MQGRTVAGGSRTGRGGVPVGRSPGGPDGPATHGPGGDGSPVATLAYRSGHDEDRLRREMLEQFHPTDLLDWCAEAENAGFTAGFMVSEHFQPWTPAQGQSAFAWSFMGALGVRTFAAVRARGDLPGVPLPPGHGRPRRGDARGHVPGSLLARARRRRGAQRAHRRRLLARDRRPLLEALRVDRDHQAAVRRQSRQAQQRVLQRRERPALPRPPRPPIADLRRDCGPGQRPADGPTRRRHDHARGGQERIAALGAVRRRAPRVGQGPATCRG